MFTLDQKFAPIRMPSTRSSTGTKWRCCIWKAKRYYSLNLTGMRIWEGLKQGLSLREISRRLQEEFRVEVGTADRCVQELVAELAEQRLVQAAD